MASSSSKSHRRHRSNSAISPRLVSLTKTEPLALASLLSTILLIALVIMGPSVLGGARPWILLPMLFVVWGLLGLQGIRLLRASGEPYQRVLDLADGAMIVFLLYAGYRYITGPVEFEARLELLTMLAAATVFWTGRYGITRRSHAVALLGVLVVVALAITIYGVLLRSNPDWTVYGESLHLHGPYTGRLMGTYGCPNHYGFLATAAALAAFAIGCFSRYSWVLRIFCIYLGLVLVGGAILSYSRGSWLGLLVGLFFLTVFAVRQSNLRWYWPLGIFAAAVILFLGAIFSSPAALSRVQGAVDIVSGEQFYRYVRIQLALDSMRILQDHPWWGTGPASFAFVHPRYQGPAYPTLAIYTHNDYLNLLTDYGIVGAFLCLIFIAAVSWKLFRDPGSRTEALDRVIASTGGAVWAAILVHSVVDFNMHIPANALVLFILTGLGLRAVAGNRTATGWLPLTWTAKLSGLLALAATVFLVLVTLRTSNGYYPRLMSEEILNDAPMEESLRLATQAYEADPSGPNLRMLGSVYRVGAGKEEDFTTRLPMARQSTEWYRQAHELNPLDDTLLVHQALGYDLMGRYTEAFLLYSQAVANQPHNGYFHYMQGMHFWRRGLLDLAKKSFTSGARAAHGQQENIRELAALNKTTKRLKQLGVTETELRQAQDAMLRAKIKQQQMAEEAALLDDEPQPPPYRPGPVEEITIP